MVMGSSLKCETWERSNGPNREFGLLQESYTGTELGELVSFCNGRPPLFCFSRPRQN